MYGSRDHTDHGCRLFLQKVRFIPAGHCLQKGKGPPADRSLRYGFQIQIEVQAKRTNEIRELASFFEGLSGPLITFDESYVRRLFSQVTVFDDKVVFAFKDGKEVTIKE